jgi:hypothetical protein
MRMYEITEGERQALIETLRQNLEFSPDVDALYAALEILGDFQEDENDTDESECE